VQVRNPHPQIQPSGMMMFDADPDTNYHLMRIPI
jgi:hypothetical protein